MGWTLEGKRGIGCPRTTWLRTVEDGNEIERKVRNGLPEKEK